MPNGWLEDEPDLIFDPTAIKPKDWNNEIDGEWEAPLVENPVCKNAPGCGKWKTPLIPNPKYKGKWLAPMIKNPNYHGKWAPRKIANPDFFKDLTPISAVGLELWAMSSDILFDNLIVTDDVQLALDVAANSFDIKRLYIDRELNSIGDKVIWGIAMGAIAVPVAFTIVSKFGLGPSKVAAARKAAAEAKKTDDPQPDDELGAVEDEKLEKGEKEEKKLEKGEKEKEKEEEKEEEKKEEKEQEKEVKKEEEKEKDDKEEEKEKKDDEEEEKEKKDDEEGEKEQKDDEEEQKDDEEECDERAAGDTIKESTPLSASHKKNYFLDIIKEEEGTLQTLEPIPKNPWTPKAKTNKHCNSI
ncbi:GD15746 [Drosophila simulans]|uniref:GD15746 n=1 Tax=Drosophila simulans TaxID=7240 RepID=B4R5U5_DROSI|nr:GD15746 [Drosophila simulans]